MRFIPSIILICFSVMFTFAQNEEVGNPFIRNFKPQEYNAHVQNWDVDVDNRGIVYVANGDGLLEYDGIEWRLHPFPSQVTTREVEVDSSGTIYCGAVANFGIFYPDSTGSLKFRSFLPLIDSTYHNFADVWSIDILGGSVYFRTNQYLFIYKNDSLKAYKPDKRFNGGFVLNSQFYVQDKGHDLHVIEGDSVRRVHYPDYPVEKRLYDAADFQEDKKLLLFKDTLCIFDPSDSLNPIRYFDFEVNQFLREKQGYSLLSIGDGKYFVGSQLNGGLMKIDTKKRTVQLIDNSKGLQQGSIYALSYDQQRNLWIALSNGISMVETSTPITFWDDRNGLNGSVEDFTKYKGEYYVATHQGVYYLDSDKAVKIKGSETQCWSFVNFSLPEKNINKLLVAIYDGIYEIRNKRLRKICLDANIYSAEQSKFDRKRVYLGLEDGLGILKYEAGKWGSCHLVEGINAEIRTIEEISSNELWLTTYRNGAIKIKLSEDLKNVDHIKHYKKDKGFKTLKNIMVYQVGDRLVFASDKGIYQYDQENDRFKIDYSFGEKIDPENRGIYALSEARNGSILFSGLNNDENGIFYGEKKFDGNYQYTHKPFLRVPEMMVLSVYNEENGALWFGGTRGLYKYSPEEKEDVQKRAFYTLIRKVELNEDSVIFKGNYYLEKHSKRLAVKNQPSEFVHEIAYNNNSITFHFTSTNHISSRDNMFCYYLEGFDDGWSSWKKTNTKQYTNLKKGTYVFHVKSKDILNNHSRETAYTFEVLPPWYLTTWAFLGYFVIGFFIIYLILRIYTWKLKSANVRLEELVKKRTKEIETQNEEILSQSEQLAKTNRELEKLSIVARETDNAVLIVNPQGEIEWINEGFSRLYGYTLDELKNSGKNIFSLSEKNDLNVKFDHCIKTKESVIYETLNTTKHGNHVWTQTTLTPILNEKGQIIKLIAIDTNINKIKQAEQEIKDQKQYIEQQNKELEKHRHHLEKLVEQRTDDLKKAKEQAENSDRLKSSFLANMSHEIRTPMNAIIGFTNMLNDPEIEDGLKNELMKQITFNSYSLLNLIDNIIDLAKIDSNQLEIKVSETEINELLQNIYESFYENITAKNITFEIKLEKDDLMVVYTDGYRLKQVLSNLLENALKFTDSGFIQIGYYLPDKDHVTFFVKDSGIGIPSDQVDVIFQRFTKVEDNKEKLYRGAGLGLNLCKTIIDKLDGKIWVDSVLHEGSEFYFTLPVKQYTS